MIDVNLPLRVGYIQATNNIMYRGVKIPFYEEYAQPTSLKPIALVTDSGIQVECYVIVLNQTQNDASPKCMRNDECSIQLQVTTRWPKLKGGSKMSSEISNLILAQLFTPDGLFSTIELSGGLKAWKGRLMSARPISYTDENYAVWITQLIITNSVSQ